MQLPVEPFLERCHCEAQYAASRPPLVGGRPRRKNLLRSLPTCMGGGPALPVPYSFGAEEACRTLGCYPVGGA